MDVLAAFIAAGGSVLDAAELVGIRPSSAKRQMADLRAWSGLTTEQLEPEHDSLSRSTADVPRSTFVQAWQDAPHNDPNG